MWVRAEQSNGFTRCYSVESIQILDTFLKKNGEGLKVQFPVKYTEITGSREQQLDQVIRSLPEDWRYRWCDNEFCRCQCCASNAGHLKGVVSKAEWQQWVSSNPFS